MAINDDGTTYNTNVANSQVNEATDTVYGQLQKHTDFESPVMKRVAQQAKDAATSRGLGNTTIAGQAATAAVIDKAGTYATKDAEIYSARRSANQQADVQLESTTLANKANIEQTNLTNDNRLQVQDKANEGALSQIASKGAIDSELAAADRVSKEGIAAADRVGQQERLDAELGSLESRTAADNEVKLQEAFAKINSSEMLGFLDNNTKLSIAKIQQDTELLRNNNESIQQAWTNYQTGLAGIDTNASSASQQTQAKRLEGSFKARMEFLNQADTLPTTTAPYGGANADTITLFTGLGYTWEDGAWKRP